MNHVFRIFLRWSNSLIFVDFPRLTTNKLLQRDYEFTAYRFMPTKYPKYAIAPIINWKINYMFNNFTYLYIYINICILQL